MRKKTAAKNSALMGVTDKLNRGERLSDEAIYEVARVLRLLQGEGWSGFIPADEALKAVIRAGEDKHQLLDALRELNGSYEALARTADSGGIASINVLMNWDGPVCARRALGQPERWTGK